VRNPHTGLLPRTGDGRRHAASSPTSSTVFLPTGSSSGVLELPLFQLPM